MSKNERRRVPRQLHLVDDTDLANDGTHSSTAAKGAAGTHSSTAEVIGAGTHSSTAQRKALLKKIEAIRREHEISIARLCAEARVHPNTYRELRRGSCIPLHITLVKLTSAIGRIRAGQEAAMERTIIQSFVRILTWEFSEKGGWDPQEMLAQDFSSEKTNDPVWLAGSHMRRCAIYIVVEVLGVGKAKLANAIGLTRQAVHKSVAAIECKRMDDEVFDLHMQAAVERAKAWA
jgi:hypothetical protein